MGYKDKSLSKEKKASVCFRGAPFGSKNAPRRDEFHQHIAQLQWKELMEKEKNFEKSLAKGTGPAEDTSSAPVPKKKGYAIKEMNNGNFVTSSNGYGAFDLNQIERPKHARVSVTKEFNDISHLG